MSDLSLLVAAADAALQDGTIRNYPYQAVDTVRRLRLMAHEQDSVLRLELLRHAGEREFTGQMGSLLANCLPRHLWCTVGDLVQQILERLQVGRGFESCGEDTAAYFCPVLGALMDDLFEETPSTFVATSLASVILAIQAAGAKMQVVLKEQIINESSPGITAEDGAVALSIYFRRLQDESLSTRMEVKQLKELNPLPALEAREWDDMKDSSPARRMYTIIGGGFLDALVIRAVSRFLLSSNYASHENHTTVYNLLISGEVAQMILRAIRSHPLGKERSSDQTCTIPNVSPADAATFLKVFIGAYAANAQHGLRALRPWLLHVYENLAEAAVKAFNPKCLVVKRKSPQTGKPPRKRSKASAPKTTRNDTPVLGDVTNAAHVQPGRPIPSSNSHARVKKNAKKTSKIAANAAKSIPPSAPASASYGNQSPPPVPKRPATGSSNSPILVSP
ncbi:hypothetical protein DFH09DRAFT_1334026 [Mycena vulgaris]|nr:hypothetical protein DFH09DRAFT_1334026 [Mycena vulgaris]